ncbi:hypothetical protein CLV98_12028 [Dyadobacter jejuensis]|uniref:Uncharacterized protein n=1 Tax=Dyadobacter jejuensis TaxID=1082580 RepID=A0A316A8R3_9BACT|nr:hypothetical protein [Dyadobacter jejuensis]PWJ53912.1 hypothetical protein CLV98_12028 [Dyadobacter jejuensis]
MNEEDLVQWVFETLSERLLKSRTNGTIHKNDSIVLVIDKNLKGNINLSDCLENSLNQVRIYLNLEKDYIKTFRVKLAGNFENLVIYSHFPNILDIRSKEGNTVELLDWDDDSFQSRIVFHGCNLKKLHLNGSYQSLHCGFGFSVNDLQVTMPPKHKMETLHIRGIINNAEIKSGHISHLNLSILPFLNKNIVSSINIWNVNFETVFISEKYPTSLLLGLCKISETLKIILENEQLSEELPNNTLIINSCQVQNVEISLDQNSGKNISIIELSNCRSISIAPNPNIHSSLNLGDFRLEGNHFEKGTKLIIRRIQLNGDITITDNVNDGDFYCHDLSLTNGVVKLKNTILGRILFHNCNLPSDWQFQSSNIENLEFYNTEMPKSFNSYRNDFLGIDTKEAFRQMKLLTSKRGQKELSDFYRARELSAHSDTLTIFNNKQFGEKLALLLNLSNENGLNYWRPFWLMLGMSSTLYSLLLLSLGYYPSLVFGSEIETIRIWKPLLDFMIPGYLYPSKSKFEFLEITFDTCFEKLSIWSKLVIFLNDILVVPYLIIQMISAFRRHISK